MVEGAGFEPAKALPADLQSAPFGQLGNPSTEKTIYYGAGGGTRIHNLSITSRVLYQLSYTG